MIGVNIFIDKTQLAEHPIQCLWQGPLKNAIGAVVKTPSLSLSFDKPYESYPYQFLNINGYDVVIEGLIYNRKQFEIEAVFSQYLMGLKPDSKGLAAAMAQWSGEWVCWFFKDKQITIISDRFGRLDTFCMFTDNSLFVGRSLNWLSKKTELEPDRLAVATYLWCCSPIGQMNLYKNVNRVAGNSIIEIDLSTGKSSYIPGQPYNFDVRQEQTVMQAATNLSGLFLQASKRMIDAWQGSPINISLSAGQDSRAVASAFVQMGNDRVFASSYLDSSSAKDVKGATEIAGILNLPYKAYPINDKPEYEQELIEKKMGMNYISMSFILDFNKQLLSDHPKGFLYVTGDGGDRTMPYIGETNSNMGLDELTRKILYRNSAMSLSQVEKLSGIKEDDFLHFLHSIMAAYPEQNNNNKSIHFNFYERAINQFMSGEDRSRYYFWTATPFYDLDFFNAAMQVPDSLKKGNKMFREFQNILNRQVADVPDGKLGYSINSMPFKIKKLGYEWFRSSPQWVRAPLRKIGGIHVNTNSFSDAERQAMVADLKQFTSMAKVLNPEEVKVFLPTANLNQYAYIRTLVELKKFIQK